MRYLMVILMIVSVVIAPAAHADETTVYVSSSIDGYDATKNRIVNRLNDSDEIAVAIYGDGEPMDLSQHPGLILIALAPDAAVVRGNGWVPQAVLDEKLSRVSNVARTPVDRALRLINEIHTWQAQNPKPEPPPPAPLPSAPFNWLPWVSGTIGMSVILVFTGLIARKRRQYAELAHRADEQQKMYDSGDLSWLEER